MDTNVTKTDWNLAITKMATGAIVGYLAVPFAFSLIGLSALGPTSGGYFAYL